MSRDEALADGRRLGWHPIDTAPIDRTVIITRPLTENQWLIRRCTAAPHYIYGFAATHWHEDTMGTPLA